MFVVRSCRVEVWFALCLGCGGVVLRCASRYVCGCVVLKCALHYVCGAVVSCSGVFFTMCVVWLFRVEVCCPL